MIKYIPIPKDKIIHRRKLNINEYKTENENNVISKMKKAIDANDEG
jgi:hypothetical protein